MKYIKIKNYKQYNEGINHLLVGPSEDEIKKDFLSNRISVEKFFNLYDNTTHKNENIEPLTDQETNEYLLDKTPHEKMVFLHKKINNIIKLNKNDVDIVEKNTEYIPDQWYIVAYIRKCEYYRNKEILNEIIIKLIDKMYENKIKVNIDNILYWTKYTGNNKLGSLIKNKFRI